MKIFNKLKKFNRNIWIRVIGETFNGIAFMMLMPFLALYLKDQVNSLFLVGLIVSISPVAAVFGTMIGGRLSDTYGRKPIMVISMLGNGCVMLGFVFCESYFAFMILSAFMGLSNSMYHPAASAMVADITDPSDRVEAFGLLRLGNNIGATLGPLIGASVVFISKSMIFLVVSFSVFIYAIAVILFLTETLPKGTIKEQSNEKNNSLPSPFKILVNDKVLLMFVLIGIIISIAFTQTEGMLPLYFDGELKHLSSELNPFPYLIAFNGTLVVLFQLPISKWASKIKMEINLLLGPGLIGISLMTLAWLTPLFFTHKTSFIVILIILSSVYLFYTLGEMLISPIQMTFISEIAPEHMRGSYMGAAGLQWIIGGALGPILAGFLLERGLGTLMLLFLGLSCVLAGICYFLLEKSRGQSKEIIEEQKKLQNNV